MYLQRDAALRLHSHRAFFLLSARYRPDRALRFIVQTVLFAIILAFMFCVYSTSDKIGSPSAMYNLLTEAATANPVPGNAHGSYLTMRSKDGLIFGVMNIIGNFVSSGPLRNVLHGLTVTLAITGDRLQRP